MTSRRTSEYGISRRDLLKALGVSTAAIAAGVQLGNVGAVRAQSAVAATASAFYNIAIGDLDVTVIQEGISSLDAAIFGANVSPTIAAETLVENNLPSPMIRSSVNTLLVRSGDRVILVDTGFGTLPFPGIEANKLVPTLGLLGIVPEAVTDVIITHFHPDHLGGVSANEGELIFTNAVHYMTDVEFNFLQNTSGTPLDDLINSAKARIQGAIDGDQFQTFAADAEVLPGITAIATPGHTPGHVSLRLASGDEQIIAAIDVANHYLLALANPTWYFGFDADPAQAVESRQALFGMLADDRLRVIGYHFPFPGVGYIDREGDGFRYLPTGF